jgi:eukaryotic-like serine/threonine-protein kinase
VVRFGAFELCLDTGELRKHGIRIRLQAQPFQILRALLEQPGCVVTRDELRRRLWPGEAFGDFESGLNTAINRLRLALGDSAEEPLYIETLARMGYRFIAPVRDGAADKQVVSQIASDSLVPLTSPPPLALFKAAPPPSRRLTPRFFFDLSGFTIMALCCAAYLVWLARKADSPLPSYHQLTFRRGIVSNARFAPSGEIVYGAAWNGGTTHLYMTDIRSPESRDLEFGPVRLAAVSRSAELAIFSPPAIKSTMSRELAIVPLHGGGPRTVAANVEDADWAPDGKVLCLIRRSDDGASIEFPPGKILYRSSGWLSSSRVSPSGDLVAFVEHPLEGDDGGRVVVVDSSGRPRRLGGDWASVHGLAWRPSGNEIWFAAAKEGLNREIHSVSLEGQTRTVASLAATLELFDIASSGRVLFGRATARLNMFAGSLAAQEQKDISWFDWSRAAGISADGNEILFDESGEGGGPNYTVYLHHRDRGTTERIEEGRALDLSRDGRWALVASRTDLSRATLVSTTDSQRRVLSAQGFSYQSARFLPTGDRIVVSANRKDSPAETYVQNLNTGAMRAVPNAAGLYAFVPSPDGAAVAAKLGAGQIAILRLATGERTLIDAKTTAFPVAWANDHSLVVASAEDFGARLDTIDVLTGKTALFRRVPIERFISLKSGCCFLISADLTTFVYSQDQSSTNLFTVDGWR